MKRKFKITFNDCGNFWMLEEFQWIFKPFLYAYVHYNNDLTTFKTKQQAIDFVNKIKDQPKEVKDTSTVYL